MADILIVEARFYEDIADELAKGAIEYLDENGLSYDRISVPGAFEIPGAIKFASQSDKGYLGYIGLGCVIRGETSHYDYVCGESARGLQDLAIRDNIALGYGILTVENADQAWARARVSDKNKGRDVAEACHTMMQLKKGYGVA